MDDIIQGLLGGSLYAVIVIPIIVGIFKKEIGDFLTSYSIYKNRPYDIDGNPDSPDVCMGMNPATGHFGVLLIRRYVFFHLFKPFSWKKCNRGVYFASYTKRKNGSYWVQEHHESLITWGGIKKTKVPQSMSTSDIEFLQNHRLIK